MNAKMTDDTLQEYCGHCERKTDHTVQIEIRCESDDDHDEGFSREPYRVSECKRCETTNSIRMNDA